MTPTPDPAAPAVEVVARLLWHSEGGDDFSFDKNLYEMQQTHPKPSSDFVRIKATAERLRTHLAANSHHAAALLPEGWVAVPTLPTQDMLQAGYNPLYKLNSEVSSFDVGDIWSAMLAASPPASGRTP